MKPRWRKISDLEYEMTLPHNWRLRVIWANNSFWLWQLHAGNVFRSTIHGYAPKLVTDHEYADAGECKAAALAYARKYFAEMAASVTI